MAVPASEIAETVAAEELDEHLRRLAALAAVELIGDSLDDVLGQVADVVKEFLPAYGASVILWDAEAERFAVSATTIPDQDNAAPARTVRRQGGASRYIVDTLQPIVVADTKLDPLGTTQFTRDHGIAAYCGVPIVAEGRANGVLYALQTEPCEWSEADVVFLEVVARRAASAIVHAHLIDETRRARDRAQVLSHVSNALISASGVEDVIEIVTDMTVAAVEADRVVVVTLDQEHRDVTHYSIGGPGAEKIGHDTFEELMGGLTGFAIRQGATVKSSRTQPDPRESDALQVRRKETQGGSLVVAPLRYDGEYVGTLTAIRNLDQPDFDDDDAALLQAMANQVAVALEQARLEESSAAAANEVRALYQVAQALNKEGGVNELLGGLAESVANALPAHQVALFLTDVDERRITHRAAAGAGAQAAVEDLTFDAMWDGLAGWVLRNRRPVFLANGDRDHRESDEAHQRRTDAGCGSLLVVPMFHSGRRLGTLTAINRDDQRSFTPRDVDLASAMAGQMAIAIANALLFEDMQHLAVTDELTGIHNRRNLFELGERELRTARRYGRPLSGIMFDIDNFKRVNDTYGHSVGDEVLVAMAQRCAAALRDVDVFGRYGGEEFAVVMPETGLSKALDVGERLRAVVADEPIATSIGPLDVTISVGVAALSSDMVNVQGLLDRADAAMFSAKHKGRNLVQAG